MTLAGLLPRPWLGAGSEALAGHEVLRVEVEPGTQVEVLLHRAAPGPPPRPLETWVPAPLVVLVHGLSGSADSGPVRGLACKLLARGFQVARMNLRNCGGTEALSSTLYCTAQSGDVLAVARAARERCDAPRVHLCGWSMGGNMVLKLAGELSAEAPPWLASVSAISPAMDLEAAQRSLDEVEGNAVYRRFFLREMLSLVRVKEARFPARFDSRGLERVATFREWDERVTAPQFGFRDADDFYRRGGARWLLGRIRIPVFAIHAQDDPFVPFAPWRDPASRPAGRFTFRRPLFGGHMSFISAGGEGGRFWAERQVLDYLEGEEGHGRALRTPDSVGAAR